MKFEIKHRFTGELIFTAKEKSLKITLEKAVNKKINLGGADLGGAYLGGADLRGADLRGAYLRGADLGGAYLGGAYLGGADLGGAYLGGADLRGADLGGAYLGGAYLGGADLGGAYLGGADLRGADLGGADLGGAYLGGAYLGGADLGGAYLRGADLRGAYLGGADLRGAKGLNKYLTTPLYLLLDQVGKIRAYKLTKENNEGIYYNGIKYIVGKTVKEKADSDENKSCSYGISLATLDWCIKEWKPSYKIKIVEFTKKDIASIPVGSDGKFRVSKCKVIKNIDLKEIGLIKDETRHNLNR